MTCILDSDDVGPDCKKWKDVKIEAIFLGFEILGGMTLGNVALEGAGKPEDLAGTASWYVWSGGGLIPGVPIVVSGGRLRLGTAVDWSVSISGGVDISLLPSLFWAGSSTLKDATEVPCSEW